MYGIRLQRKSFKETNQWWTAPGVNDTSPATCFFCTYIDMYVLYATIGKIAISIRHSHTIKWKNVSWEIDDFVETHLCKLRGVLRSRVLGVLCDLIKNVSPYWGRQKSDSYRTQWGYKYVAVGMCATVFTFVGRNLINSSMRGNKWSYITRWIGQTITRNRTVTQNTKHDLLRANGRQNGAFKGNRWSVFLYFEVLVL